MPRQSKSEFVRVRCTPEERAKWQARAEAEGVTVSDLLRRGGDMPPSGRPKPRPVIRRTVEADPALIRQLAGIGNNLNQLARIVNQYGIEPEDVTRILTYLAAMQADLEQLRADAQPVVADAH